MKIDITRITQTPYFYYEHLLKVTKKPDKWKKYSVSIIVLAASFIQIWSTSDFSVVQVTSVEKKGILGTFLSLSLRPRLQKTFPRFPFFYFGNLDNTSIRQGQICPQTWQHNYRNKILFSSILILRGFWQFVVIPLGLLRSIEFWKIESNEGILKKMQF